MAVAATADPYDTTTWHRPCWNCGHTPGCEWIDYDAGLAQCAACGAD